MTITTRRRGIRATYNRAVRVRPRYLAMRAYTRARILRGRIAPPGPWQGIRVLGYHRISDDRHVLSVRPAAFRRQLEAALASGLAPLSVPEALDRLQAKDVDGRFFCVTFDDGYLDNLEHAVPALRELGIPATIFVPTRIIDGEAPYWWFPSPPPALDWDQLRELVGEGLVDVQSHTRTHPWLPPLSDEDAWTEIEGSKHELEDRLARPVTTFCYPGGLYGDRDARLVREAGYRAAFTTHPGVNDGSEPPERLKRTLVYWEDSDSDFRAKLDGLLDAPPALRAWLYRRRVS
jgi:peptidoglycan/xylan/chitin deacetylase (PgdA/CDA1 family)